MRGCLVLGPLLNGERPFHKLRRDDMTKPAKGTVRKPEGIKQALLQKTRSGRKTQEAVFELRQHTSGRNDLAPRLTLEYLPPASLKDARRRVRKADAAQVARIEKSIRELGCSKPVLVGDDLVIVDGHSIRDASINLQIPAIPVIRVDHLSPARAACASNRAQQDGGDRLLGCRGPHSRDQRAHRARPGCHVSWVRARRNRRAFDRGRNAQH